MNVNDSICFQIGNSQPMSGSESTNGCYPRNGGKTCRNPLNRLWLKQELPVDFLINKPSEWWWLSIGNANLTRLRMCPAFSEWIPRAVIKHGQGLQAPKKASGHETSLEHLWPLLVGPYEKILSQMWLSSWWPWLMMNNNHKASLLMAWCLYVPGVRHVRTTAMDQRWPLRGAVKELQLDITRVSCTLKGSWTNSYNHDECYQCTLGMNIQACQHEN